MKCFNCGYSQIEKNVKNCPICGVSLAKLCPNCSTANPVSAKFCLECGTSLEVLNKRDRMFKAGIIFADISGFTSLAEKFDPETTKDIVNECFRLLTEPIYRYGGHIDKYIGDCVMAVFGMDNDTLDVPLKTVQCALEMREAINSYHKRLVKEQSLGLGVSIGVTYGEVLLGNVGSQHDVDYTVIGDNVNVASRFQTIANPGEIRVGKNIYESTYDQIFYSEKEFLSLKNKENPVESYLAFSKVENTSNIYIKREFEYEVGQFINSDQYQLLITGEAGVGKSTTIKHILQQLPSTKKTVYIQVYKSMSNAFFGVIEDTLKEIIGIGSSDSPNEKKQKLSEYLAFIFDDKETLRLFQFLSILLKLQVDKSFDSTIEAMDYHDLMDELKRQFRLFITQLDSKMDLIIVVDNFEIADSQSRDLLLNLDTVCRCIFISRESITENMNRIIVEPFKKNTLNEYVNLQCSIELSEELIEYVFNLSKGYPRFIDAILRQLEIHNKEAENKQIELTENLRDFLPKTVENIHKYRFNQLKNSIKDILEIASVFVDVFSFHEIFILLDTKYVKFSIEEVLAQGIVTEVTYERINDETVYYYRFIEDEFKNAIYDSLLDKNKKEYHKQIFELLVSKDAVQEEVLAYHALESNQKALASKYYNLAAANARKQFDLDKAEKLYELYLELSLKDPSMVTMDASIEFIKVLMYKSQFDKALDWIEKCKQINDSDNYQSRLLLLQADIFKMIGRIPEILPIIENLEKRLQKSSRNYGKLLQLKSSVYNMTGQPGVIELTEQSKELLLKSRDYESLIETLSEAGIRSFIEGNLQKGIEYLEDAMGYANQISNKASLLKVLGNLGIFYSQFGERDKAEVYFKNAMTLAKEISNQRHYIATSINLAVSYLSIGSFNQALSLLEEAVNLTKESKIVVQQCISLTNLGDVYYELGRYDEAYASYQESDQLALAMDMPIDHAINQIGILKIWTKQKNDKDILSISNELLKILEDAGELTYLASLHYVLTDFYINKEDYESALTMIKKSLDYAQKSHDEMQQMRSMRKQIEVLIRLESNDIESYIKKATVFGEQSNLYYELAKMYLMLHNEKPAFHQYIYKAKEMSLFFDECLLTNKIHTILD